MSSTISLSWTVPVQLTLKCISLPIEIVQSQVWEGEGQVSVQQHDCSTWCSARHVSGQKSEQCKSSPQLCWYNIVLIVISSILLPPLWIVSQLPLFLFWQLLPHTVFYLLFCSIPQVSYKKDAKANLHYTSVVDRPDIKKATQAAKLISEVMIQYRYKM